MASRVRAWSLRFYGSQERAAKAVGIPGSALSAISRRVRKPYGPEERKLIAVMGVEKYRQIVGEPRFRPREDEEAKIAV